MSTCDLWKYFIILFTCKTHPCVFVCWIILQKYYDHWDADVARRELDGQEFHGRRIVVDLARAGKLLPPLFSTTYMSCDILINYVHFFFCVFWSYTRGLLIAVQDIRVNWLILFGCSIHLYFSCPLLIFSLISSWFQRWLGRKALLVWRKGSSQKKLPEQFYGFQVFPWILIFYRTRRRFPWTLQLDCMCLSFFSRQFWSFNKYRRGRKAT
jgi:hypothetical protein